MTDVVVLKQTAIRKEEQPGEPERAVKTSVIPMVTGAWKILQTTLKLHPEKVQGRCIYASLEVDELLAVAADVSWCSLRRSAVFRLS